MSFGTDSFSFRRGLSKAVLLASTLLLSVQSHAFQSNAPFGLHEKAIERIDLASKVSPVQIEGAFGDSFAAYHGSVGFSVTDVSIPGNSNLPVSVTGAARPIGGRPPPKMPAFSGTQRTLAMNGRHRHTTKRRYLGHASPRRQRNGCRA